MSIQEEYAALQAHTFALRDHITALEMYAAHGERCRVRGQFIRDANNPNCDCGLRELVMKYLGGA